MTQVPTVCIGICELMKFISKLFFSLLKLFLINMQIYLLYDTLLYIASVTEDDVRYPHLAIWLVHWLFQIAPSYFCDTFMLKKVWQNFSFWFLHISVSPWPWILYLEPFWIFKKTHECIRKSTTPVIINNFAYFRYSLKWPSGILRGTP